MKRFSSIIASCAVLVFALSGCGADVNDAESALGVRAQDGIKTGLTASAASQPIEESTSSTDARGGAAGGPTDPAGFGKRCYATCSVVSVGAASCPPDIGGYGNTTFLGGCNKACGKAQGDAASKLPAGCVINTCSFSGC